MIVGQAVRDAGLPDQALQVLGNMRAAHGFHRTLCSGRLRRRLSARALRHLSTSAQPSGIETLCPPFFIVHRSNRCRSRSPEKESNHRFHGKRYIDACGGAAVSCLGHSNQRVLEAIERQAKNLPYAHTSFFTTAPAEELAERLVAPRRPDSNMCTSCRAVRRRSRPR